MIFKIFPTMHVFTVRGYQILAKFGLEYKELRSVDIFSLLFIVPEIFSFRIFIYFILFKQCLNNSVMTFKENLRVLN
jgi:hypothetical protein